MTKTTTGKKWYPLRLFKPLHYLRLKPGDLFYRSIFPHTEEASGPYRCVRVEHNPGRWSGVVCRIVGMEESGEFGVAAGFVLVPTYRKT